MKALLTYQTKPLIYLAFAISISLGAIKRPFGEILKRLGCILGCFALGFVGLIVPHITRIIIGSDYRFLFPNEYMIREVFNMQGSILEDEDNSCPYFIPSKSID